MNNLGTAPRAGIKTTELWVTVLSMVLTFLAIKGVITASQVDPLLNAFMQVYGGVVGLLTIFGIARAYVQSRTKVKTQLIDAASQAQVEPNLPIDNTVKIAQ